MIPTRSTLCIVLMLTLAVVVLAGQVLPLDPAGLNLTQAWDGPTAAHPCGRDGLGRDLLARLLTGTGTTLGIAAAALGLAVVCGFGLGGLAGWYGGILDSLIMRTIDILMGVRELTLAIVIAVLLGPGGGATILILALSCTPPIARLVRTLILAQRGQAHVLAAVALGASPFRACRCHILPNIAGPIMVRSAALIGPLIQAETALSFLGIGIQDPAASLGTLIRDGLSGLRTGPHLIVFTTAMVVLVVLTFILLADELRDRFDPRSSRMGVRVGIGGVPS